MDSREGVIKNKYFNSKFLICFFLFFTFLYIASHLHLSQYFPIKIVHVYGINRVEPQEVQSLLIPLVSNGFFSVNVEHIRERLMQLPWVTNTLVKRKWPDQIHVTIIERQPIAYWNNSSLLSESGELFLPSSETMPSGLPTFKGPQGSQMTMLDCYNKINRIFIPLHAKIAYLELTPYLTWKLKLDNGITLQIGHKEILTRLDHFVKVYPKIVGNRATNVDYIDLRYPNGMAVKFKTAVKT